MTEDHNHPWLDDPQHDLELTAEERDYLASMSPRTERDRLLAEGSWPEVPYKGVHRASELDEEAA